MLADCLGFDNFPFTTTTNATATTMMKSVEDVAQTPFETSDSVLERFYLHVKERPDAPYLTQPITGQETPTVYTFKEVYDEARMLAAHIQSYKLDKQSKIAVISKNCAHFFITELAIWMRYVPFNVVVSLILRSSNYLFIFCLEIRKQLDPNTHAFSLPVPLSFFCLFVCGTIRDGLFSSF